MMQGGEIMHDLVLLGFHVAVRVLLPFAKEEKSILGQPRHTGTWVGVEGDSVQHRTDSSKELHGLHLQGDLPPPLPHPPTDARTKRHLV